jgi:hypothetical protein
MDIVERSTLGENLYRVTIAANEHIRQAPELDFPGLSTENYDKNPVVMWAHDVAGRSPSAGLPIGRTLKLTKAADGRVVADFEFLSEDPFAQRVKNAWDKGFLQAASISWVPLEGGPVDGGRWRDTRSELLEWSIVAVPADPDALKESHRRMIDELVGEANQEAPGTQDSGMRREGADDGLSTVRAGEMGGDHRMLSLSPEQRYGLAEAYALLGDVVGGVQRPREANQHDGAATPVEWILDGDLTEIKRFVGALREALGVEGSL